MDINELNILNYAIENDIINIGDIRMQVEMNEKLKYLDMHKFDVWQGKDGKWRTYVTDDKSANGRKMIKRNNEESLKEAVIKHYKDMSTQPTVEDIFKLWLIKKLEQDGISRQTVDRYWVDFNRFFSKIKIKKIRCIDEVQLEDFIFESINKYKLTSKAWGNLRIILRGLFKFAKKRGYTNLDINTVLNDLEFSKKTFRHQKRNDENNIFTVEEINLILDYIKNHPSINHFGILIGLYTGMRVGEIVVLQWNDIYDDYIYVHRQLIRYKDEQGKTIYEIRDSPKTEAGVRKVLILPQLKPVIKQLRLMNPFGTYIFMKNNKVMTTHAISMSLYYICEKVGIHKRGMHVLRKTFATHLINDGVEESIITALMGHTDIETTKNHYYFNDKNIYKMTTIIQKAINY